jgi:hypothetical protein
MEKIQKTHKAKLKRKRSKLLSNKSKKKSNHQPIIRNDTYFSKIHAFCKDVIDSTGKYESGDHLSSSEIIKSYEKDGNYKYLVRDHKTKKVSELELKDLQNEFGCMILWEYEGTQQILIAEKFYSDHFDQITCNGNSKYISINHEGVQFQSDNKAELEEKMQIKNFGSCLIVERGVKEIPVVRCRVAVAQDHNADLNHDIEQEVDLRILSNGGTERTMERTILDTGCQTSMFVLGDIKNKGGKKSANGSSV